MRGSTGRVSVFYPPLSAGISLSNRIQRTGSRCSTETCSPASMAEIPGMLRHAQDYPPKSKPKYLAYAVMVQYWSARCR